MANSLSPTGDYTTGARPRTSPNQNRRFVRPKGEPDRPASLNLSVNRRVSLDVDGFADRMPGQLERGNQSVRTDFHLLGGVVIRPLARRQTGDRNRQRQQIQKLMVTARDFVVV